MKIFSKSLYYLILRNVELVYSYKKHVCIFLIRREYEEIFTVFLLQIILYSYLFIYSSIHVNWSLRNDNRLQLMSVNPDENSFSIIYLEYHVNILNMILHRDFMIPIMNFYRIRDLHRDLQSIPELSGKKKILIIRLSDISRTSDTRYRIFVSTKWSFSLRQRSGYHYTKNDEN